MTLFRFYWITLWCCIFISKVTFGFFSCDQLLHSNLERFLCYTSILGYRGGCNGKPTYFWYDPKQLSPTTSIQLGWNYMHTVTGLKKWGWYPNRSGSTLVSNFSTQEVGGGGCLLLSHTAYRNLWRWERGESYYRQKKLADKFSQMLLQLIVSDLFCYICWNHIYTVQYFSSVLHDIFLCVTEN